MKLEDIKEELKIDKDNFYISFDLTKSVLLPLEEKLGKLIEQIKDKISKILK